MYAKIIADYLELEVTDIKEVRIFKWVYLVIFNIRKRPTFVSKKKLASGKIVNLIPRGQKKNVISLSDPSLYQNHTYLVLARTISNHSKYAIKRIGDR